MCGTHHTGVGPTPHSKCYLIRLLVAVTLFGTSAWYSTTSCSTNVLVVIDKISQRQLRLACGCIKICIISKHRNVREGVFEGVFVDEVKPFLDC